MEVKAFTDYIKNDMHSYLKAESLVDEKFPECPDVEEKWSGIEKAYLPDGAREFKDYPIVSLGWAMFIGMAIAKFWDYDWDKYGKETGETLYISLRNAKGYDNMDDYILKDVLGYNDEEAEKISAKVGECASRILSALHRANFESGTSDALRAYQASLLELYLAGMALELNSLGYHYVPFNAN